MNGFRQAVATIEASQTQPAKPAAASKLTNTHRFPHFMWDLIIKSVWKRNVTGTDNKNTKHHKNIQPSIFPMVVNYLKYKGFITWTFISKLQICYKSHWEQLPLCKLSLFYSQVSQNQLSLFKAASCCD